MESKYKGIDERKIKCSCNDENCIESGISFDTDNEGNSILRFHFLQYETFDRVAYLFQETKSMILDKKTAQKLIKELKKII